MYKIASEQSRPALQEALPTPSEPTPASIRWNWGDLLLIFFVSLAFLLAGSVLFFALLPTEALLVVSSLLLEAVALVGSVYWLGLRRRGKSWAALGIGSISRRWLLGALGLGLLLTVVTGWVGYSLQALLGHPNVNPQQDLFSPSGLSWVSILGTILFGGIAVPFAEELLFRGVLYRFLREQWGVWIGALVSAALFGAAHLDLSVAAGIGGLVCALLYERSKSLWPSILIHAVNNSLKFILFYAVLATSMKLPWI
jgi:membrane protease YdiL (CAAX protease family)